ncbi:MAG: penicillin-binding transpeptidase domain-containing protein [Patescibacteria group bacterium]
MKNKNDAIFSDFISTRQATGRRNPHGKEYHLREFFLPVFLVLIVAGLFAKTFWVQIIRGDYYRNLSDTNRIRTIPVHAPRGVVLDRNGKPLVYNIPGFRETVNGKTKVLTNDEALVLIAQGKKDLEVDALRSYPYKEMFSHVLGYIGQISPEELKQPEFSDYLGNDLIGKMGIEAEYEPMLKGEDGKELVEVNSLGKSVRKLGKTDPIPGENITVNLDLNIQKAAFSAMENVKKGAAIVSTPKGEIIAMISKPSFDHNFFTLGATYKTATSSGYQNLPSILTDGESQPLLNRPVSGTYPPGSTFKLVVASAGLENKIIDENFKVEDKGRITVGEFSFANWYFTQYGRTDGEVDVVKGIQRSNDVFFYKLGEKIGVDKISKTASEFGLGKKLGIDLNSESTGLVPTQKWKQKEIGEPWYLGDTYHYSIGQGYLLTTPLQVNTWAEVIANGGTLYRPHILRNEKLNEPLKTGLLNDETRSLIRQGMINSCSPGGVAWPFFDFKVKNPRLKIDNKNYFEAPQATSSAGFKDYRKVSVACKTGTAEHGGKKTLPHAWITLFAPAYDPEIVVTVLSEESGEGSNIAAPIAKKILEDYFTRKKD